MRWYKNPSNWVSNSVRYALTYQQRDIYHCLKGLAGQRDYLDREGYLERSVGIPYSTIQLSALVGEEVEVIDATIDILKEHGVISITPEGCIQFLDWIPVDRAKAKRQQSPAEKEYFEKASQERLNRVYPDGVSQIVDDRIRQLIDAGKLQPIEDGDDDGTV